MMSLDEHNEHRAKDERGALENPLLQLLEDEFSDFSHDTVLNFSENILHTLTGKFFSDYDEDSVVVRVCKNGHLTCSFRVGTHPDSDDAATSGSSDA